MKKALLIPIALISISLSAQDALYNDKTSKDSPKSTVSDECASYVSVIYDKVEGKTFIQTKAPLNIFDENQIGFSIYMTIHTGIKVLIWVIGTNGGSTCIEEGSKINVLFTDETRLQLTNNHKYNCDKEVAVMFGNFYGKKQELQFFKTKKIETLRVWTNDGYVERNFDDEQATALQQTFICISELNK